MLDMPLQVKTAVYLLWLSLMTGCATTKAHMIETAPRLPPTCAAAVHLFTSSERVPATYQDLALLRVTGNDFAGSGTMFNSLRQKAAELGANGLVYRSMDTSPGLFQDPHGEAVAIYIPSDTARIAGECAAEARERAAEDSRRRNTRSGYGQPWAPAAGRHSSL
jgi:hypothetical protein